jgi:hypothetical protein
MAAKPIDDALSPHATDLSDRPCSD